MERGVQPAYGELTKLRENFAWYVEWKQMSVLWHDGSLISHLQLIHLCLRSLLFTNQCYIRRRQKLPRRGGQFVYCSGRNSGIKVCSPFQPDINQVIYCLIQMQSRIYDQSLTGLAKK